jgi:hypothetical protein
MFFTRQKLTSEQCNHVATLTLPVHCCTVLGSSAEEAVTAFLEGGGTPQCKHMPVVFHGHMLQRDETKNQICTMRGTKTQGIRGCDSTICRSTGCVTCWAWHLEDAASGAADEVPVQWQPGKPP